MTRVVSGKTPADQTKGKRRQRILSPCTLYFIPCTLLLALCLGCAKPQDPRFVEVKAERDVGLLRTLTIGDTEYGLLQLNRYSSLYGAKDFWLSWRKKGEAWQEPLFTGVVYQFAPPELRYIPTKVLDFRLEGDVFTIEIGLPPEKAKNYPDITPISRSFRIEELRQDSDKDGLTDVTERLFQLDPQNPDSDGDGVLDGADRDPQAAPRDDLTEEERLMLAAFSLYKCKPGEPVIFQQGPNGPFPIPVEGCINLSMSKEQIESYLAPDAEGRPRYDRSIDVIRFASKIEGDRAKVKLGNDVGFQVWAFRRQGDTWVFEKAELPEIYDK